MVRVMHRHLTVSAARFIFASNAQKTAHARHDARHNRCSLSNDKEQWALHFVVVFFISEVNDDAAHQRWMVRESKV